MRQFFQKLIKNIQEVFRKKYLLWHFLAIALTFLLVESGFDWRYFEATRNSTLLAFFWPAVVLGGFIPLFGVLGFFAFSLALRKKPVITAALALGQAVILAFLISGAYKFFTGRPGPPHELANLAQTDISHVFHFGFYRGGVFFGWPSTHAMIAFAMAWSLISLFPQKRALKFLVAVYALYIGIGVSMTIHWFSDFIAGAIIGIVIGIIVGKSFRKNNN